MGQIVSAAAKPKRCNANQLSQVPTPAAGEHILVSSDNSMNAAGQGNFDCYIVGDGTTAATALELKRTDDKTIRLEQEVFSGVTLELHNNVHTPFNFYSGKSYVLTNNSETSCQIYVRKIQGSAGQVYLGNIAAGSRVVFTPEADYNYLYPYLSSGTATYTINVKYNDSLVNAINISVSNERAFASVNSRALGGNSNIAFKGYLGDYTWLGLDNSSHILIICKSGDAIAITSQAGKGSQFCFLKDYNLLDNNILYCEGTGRIQISSNTTATYTAPEDVKFLAVTTKSLGNDICPASIKINDIEVPFVKETVKDCLDKLENDLNESKSDLTSDMADLYSEVVTGATVMLAGTETSNLVLVEPILLTENGDEVEISVNTDENTQGLGMDFSNSGLASNSYYAIQLSVNRVGVRAVDGTWLHSSTSIPNSNQHIVRISYANGNILTYVDDVLVNTYQGQKDIRIASFGNGGNGTYGYWGGTINYVKHNGESLNLITQQANDAVVTKQYRFALANTSSSYPKGILKYNAASKVFDFYSRLGDSNKYFMFRVRLHTNDTDLVYLKEWRWSEGFYCEYNNGVFNQIAVTAIDVENEMAMHFRNTIDYTGGIHGDERIDVSPDSFVKFFADGRLISDAELTSDFTIECASFAYVQLSSLHETSVAENEFVDGHPIIAMHYKRNTFENCQSHLENRIIFTSEQYVTQYHAGIMCIGKGAATYALLPNASMTQQLTGTNNFYDADNKKIPRVDMWNPANAIRCHVEGRMVEGISENDINDMLVWDRSTDSKYYRRMNVSNSNAKVFHQGDVIINEQDVVYY